VDERPAPRIPPGTTEWIHICERCGERMEERQCKIVCNNCGSLRDCSDP
jgi:anaerobic ribonucleoside-triphosphate reductase